MLDSFVVPLGTAVWKIVESRARSKHNFTASTDTSQRESESMTTEIVAANVKVMPANATIYLIRHAEKPEEPESGTGLSPAGQARADAYVHYFQNLVHGGQKIRWDYIFASKASNSSDRPVLTVTPLAAALHLTIDSTYKDKDYRELADAIQGNPADYSNKNVLICWHHGKELDLAQALGASPETLPESSAWPSTWPGDVFGWLLKIVFTVEGALDVDQTVAINEALMSDDTTTPTYGRQ
jgi:hypothetical protein